MAYENNAINYDTTLKINDDLLKLFTYLSNNEVNVDKSKSICMDSSSIINVLRPIFYGAAGKTKEILNATNLKEIINAGPRSMYNRTGIFIRPGFEYKTKFHSKFNDKLVLDYLDTQRDINTIVSKKFPHWPLKNDKFFPNGIDSYCDGDQRLVIKDQSYFSGTWAQCFDKNDGKNDVDFFIGGNKSVKVHMMSTDEPQELLTYFDEEFEINYVSLPYKDGYEMLVIMPEIPHTKKQLINLLENERISTNSINNFYKSLGNFQMYDRKKMPKFEFETKFELSSYNSEDVNCPKYLQAILDDQHLDLTNIAKNFPIGAEEISFQSTTKLNNMETGTYIRSVTEMLVTDCSPSNILELNKSFIFIILQPKTMVFNDIGICLGK